MGAPEHRERVADHVVADVPRAVAGETAGEARARLAGEQPACVEACNANGHQAMIFGDLKNPESALSQALKSQASTEVRADLGLNTGVRYQGI